MKTKNETDFNSFLKAVGKRIKETREKKGITQAEMCAEPGGFERRNWQRIEAGERNLTLKTLHRIAQKFDVLPEDLLTITKKK